MEISNNQVAKTNRGVSNNQVAKRYLKLIEKTACSDNLFRNDRLIKKSQ